MNTHEPIIIGSHLGDMIGFLIKPGSSMYSGAMYKINNRDSRAIKRPISIFLFSKDGITQAALFHSCR